MTVDSETERAAQDLATAGDLAATARYVLALPREGAAGDSAAEAGAAGGDAEQVWRTALAEVVHEGLMRARTDGSGAPPVELALVAEALRYAPDAAVDRLPPRIGILIALLRAGHLEPAWMLAHDNASGRVGPARTVATWAGRSALRDPLPVPFHIEDGAVFAYLPGFRDPRWSIDDEIYRVDRRIRARVVLDGAEFRGRELALYGAGYLTLLATGADDAVSVLLAGPDGARHRVPAMRARRPELVKPHGAEPTRLAFAGWRAAIPLEMLTPGRWRFSLEVSSQGVSRAAALGVVRGPLAAPELVEQRELVGGPMIVEVAGCAVRLGSEGPGTSRPGQLVVQVRRLPLRTRILPRALRVAARDMRRRRSGS